MKKTKMKRMIASIITLVTLFTLAQPTLAAQPNTVSPQYTNAKQAVVSLRIDSSGTASVSVTCYGSTSLKQTKITTYIEKLVGSSWERVNIGEPDNAWQYTTTSQVFNKTYSAQLSSTGTYRAVTEFTLTASTVEHITVTSAASY